MWVIMREIEGQNRVVSVQIDAPPTMAGHTVFEWFGPVPEYYREEMVMPDGEVIPAQEGLDPRTQGYETHRDKMEDLLTAAGGEVDWLNLTIPDIDTMTAGEVRDVVKRLAQENLKMVQAWRYVLNRLLNS